MHVVHERRLAGWRFNVENVAPRYPADSAIAKRKIVLRFLDLLYRDAVVGREIDHPSFAIDEGEILPFASQLVVRTMVDWRHPDPGFCQRRLAAEKFGFDEQHASRGVYLCFEADVRLTWENAVCLQPRPELNPPHTSTLQPSQWSRAVRQGSARKEAAK